MQEYQEINNYCIIIILLSFTPGVFSLLTSGLKDGLVSVYCFNSITA